jgi:hypothetical protein
MLDSEGVAFPCGVVLQEYGSLPVINCNDVSGVIPGRRVPLETVRQSLDLAQLIKRKNWSSPMALEQINIENDFTLVAQMNSDAVLTFRPTDLERQLARLDAILQKTAAAGRRVATVNLQLNRNVPVTLQEAETAAAAPSPPTGKPNPGNPGNPAGRPSGGGPSSGGAKRTSTVSADEEELRGVIRGA